MKHLFILFLIPALLLPGCYSCQSNDTPEVTTLCNPMDLSYRFCIDKPSRREAADPTVVWFRDRYYLFASKSGGYWHSKDLAEWIFIETTQIPAEEYAPTAVALNDTLYFLASSNERSTVYKSAHPLEGKWIIAVEELERPIWDPAFFLDDDNRLYLYWGCSDSHPLYGVEVDYNNHFRFLGKPLELIAANSGEHGWEVPGDYNTITERMPWIEGAWMNKINGKYYLQYAGPGTEYKSYSDGVYVSDCPLGPFVLQKLNPFACKPEGFAAGAGHGSTFADRYGNLWHIGTMTISQKHMFERRLGLFPVFTDDEGTMYCDTRFGDYPYILPHKKINTFEDIFPGWMLLSYNKPVEVSSFVDSLPASYMTDEDIRTYWAAKSGNEGVYALLDLSNTCAVYAVQVNFAEHDTGIYGRQEGLCYRYIIEYSKDKINWKTLIDKSKGGADRSHDYTQLEEKVECRYLRIINIQIPGGAFALSGFRVFGKGQGTTPDRVTGLKAVRDTFDRRKVHLTWNRPENATGYIIRYGIDSTRLYMNYMVYQDTSLTINSLNARYDYYFTIDAFNENGYSLPL